MGVRNAVDAVDTGLGLSSNGPVDIAHCHYSGGPPPPPGKCSPSNRCHCSHSTAELRGGHREGHDAVDW